MDLEGFFEQHFSRKTRSGHKVRTPGMSHWWLETCEVRLLQHSDEWEWFVRIWPKINDKITFWWGNRKALTSPTHYCLWILTVKNCTFGQGNYFHKNPWLLSSSKNTVKNKLFLGEAFLSDSCRRIALCFPQERKHPCAPRGPLQDSAPALLITWWVEVGMSCCQCSETKGRGSQFQLDFIQSCLFPKVPADLNYCSGCQQVPPAYSVMIKVLRGFGLLMFLSVAADCEHKGCIK